MVPNCLNKGNGFCSSLFRLSSSGIDGALWRADFERFASQPHFLHYSRKPPPGPLEQRSLKFLDIDSQNTGNLGVTGRSTTHPPKANPNRPKTLKNGPAFDQTRLTQGTPHPSGGQQTKPIFPPTPGSVQVFDKKWVAEQI